MIRRPPRSTQSRSSAASDVYKRQSDNRYIEKLLELKVTDIITATSGEELKDEIRECLSKDGMQRYKQRIPVSYTHLRAHETVLDLVCRLLLEKKKQKIQHK